MDLVFFGAHGAVPTRDSGNVSFLVRGGGWTLMADASGNPVQSLLKAGTDPLFLDCVVLTHTHTDHLYALPSLIHTLWMMKRRKPLVLLADTVTEVRAKELLSLFNLGNREGLFPLRFHYPADGFDISEEARVRLFPVSHSVPTNGFRLSSGGLHIVYTADTAPLSTLRQDAGSADILIHEASGTEEDEPRLNPAGHSSARQAALAAENIGARTLILCHAPPGEDSASGLRREAERTFRRGAVLFPRPFYPYRAEEFTEPALPR